MCMLFGGALANRRVVLRESNDGYAVAYEEDGMFCLATGGVIVSSYKPSWML